MSSSLSSQTTSCEIMLEKAHLNVGRSFALDCWYYCYHFYDFIISAYYYCGRMPSLVGEEDRSGFDSSSALGSYESGQIAIPNLSFPSAITQGVCVPGLCIGAWPASGKGQGQSRRARLRKGSYKEAVSSWTKAKPLPGAPGVSQPVADPCVPPSLPG